MPRVLITSGPTRQYFDPVRYLTNGSTGQMGVALAESALAAGYDVTIVSGPVAVAYPSRANVIGVETTAEMLQATMEQFPEHDGIIAAAAPCDFQPETVLQRKLKKTSDAFSVRFIPTDDILETVGDTKRPEQWSVGFALETDNRLANAIRKREQKNCDLIVLNEPAAVGATHAFARIIGAAEEIVADIEGTKRIIADAIFAQIRRIEAHRRSEKNRPL